MATNDGALSRETSGERTTTEGPTAAAVDGALRSTAEAPPSDENGTR
jgi:hypothetical protein